MSTPHRITVRARNPEANRIMTGMNCEVLMDGEKLRNCKSIVFSCDAKGIASVKLDIFAEVCIENVLGEVDAVVVKPTPIDVPLLNFGEFVTASGLHSSNACHSPGCGVCGGFGPCGSPLCKICKT